MYPVQRVTCHELLLLTILYVSTCTPTGTCDILCQEFPQVRLVSPCLTLAVLKVLLGAWLLGNLTLCGKKLIHGFKWVHLLLDAQDRVCSSWNLMCVTKASRNWGSILQSLQTAEGDCKPGTENHPAAMGRRWRTGYDLIHLIQNGLACKSDIAGLQKATHTEVSTRKHPCHYHCPAGYSWGALTIETLTVCTSTGLGVAGDWQLGSLPRI